MRLFCLAFFIASTAAAQQPAISRIDAPRDAARLEVLHIPSGGVEIFGVAHVAAGPGPHPTLVIAHGWPGNEKNLDLAQAVRRAGWNAVTFNYRGSWGSPGSFRFAQVPQDTAAVIAWLRRPEVAARLGVDPKRIALAGHSMGGWSTAMAAAKDPALVGAITISMGDMGLVGGMTRADLVKRSAENAEALAGTSPELMADELIANAAANRAQAGAPGLAKIPMLILSSDDGLAPMSDGLATAIRKAGGTRVTTAHVATDHSWSDHRLTLQGLVIEWLQGLRQPVP